MAMRTITGVTAAVHGEDSIIGTGHIEVKHRILVANIEEDAIRSMDIMSARGFQLDLNREVLKKD